MPPTALGAARVKAVEGNHPYRHNRDLSGPRLRDTAVAARAVTVLRLIKWRARLSVRHVQDPEPAEGLTGRLQR